ncbi:formate/nitrite transporter family protein [Acetobacter sp. AN02]|uniref:formate/nitrite transporter family protein n=1 Tax=Acetobacter sp. AN02 TaxID=2894186 RepID=UPI0024340DF6|nr:formate/nitrite transporter family protein [Acetobacter sp. AN02]MDG6094071.1 formate/nitrite transporter family protein [Acetobacter sp. AN02]
MTDAAGSESLFLDEGEQRQAEERAAPGPLVIYEIVREQGLEELKRPTGSLAWSGLAAGLSIGFSFLTESSISAGLPDAPWARLLAAPGYSIGFLIVVLGQQQLFTETTLTALIPVLTPGGRSRLADTARVWSVVLAANILGTFLLAALLAIGTPGDEALREAMVKLASHVISQPFFATCEQAAFAGWLIALMVWMLPAAHTARAAVIIILTSVVAMCQLPHAIAGSAEAAYLVFTGHASMMDYLTRFFAPTLLGNCIGGIALVAILNHAQVAGQLILRQRRWRRGR